jgi:hypothetical protein
VDITTQLRELADRAEVSELVSRYVLAVDERRVREATDLYVDGFVLDFPAAVFRLVRPDPALPAVRYHVDTPEPLQELTGHTPYSALQHMTSNVIVELSGDTAHVRANLIAAHVHERPDSHFDLGGIYEFDAVRTDDGWRLSRVKLSQVWTGGDAPAPDTL